MTDIATDNPEVAKVLVAGRLTEAVLEKFSPGTGSGTSDRMVAFTSETYAAIYAAVEKAYKGG